MIGSNAIAFSGGQISSLASRIVRKRGVRNVLWMTGLYHNAIANAAIKTQKCQIGFAFVVDIARKLLKVPD